MQFYKKKSTKEQTCKISNQILTHKMTGSNKDQTYTDVDQIFGYTFQEFLTGIDAGMQRFQ